MILTEELKKQIDAMSALDMAEFFRNARPNHPWVVSDEINKYLVEKFREKGRKKE